VKKSLTDTNTIVLVGERFEVKLSGFEINDCSEAQHIRSLGKLNLVPTLELINRRILMHNKTLKRYVAYSLSLAALVLPAALVKPQQRNAPPKDELPIVRGDCHPITKWTLTAPNLLSFDPADFTPGQVSAPHMTGLGDPSVDKNYLNTFVIWKKDKRCCQITKARLIVNMKANSTCQSHTGHDAGNDSINIMHAGLTVPTYADYIYPGTGSCNVGQTATYTQNLNAAALAAINQSGELSFAVQDDTQVVSATLEVWGCCLTAAPAQAIGQSSPPIDGTE
jgi:hypothetical protein